MKKTSILGLMMFIIASTAFAQEGWNWPEDPDKRKTAEEKNALYTDMYKAERYAEAKKSLEWLLKEVPDLNPSIYINGVKIYAALSETEKSTTVRNNLQDSVIILYDMRMEYFNDVNNVMNRKSYDAYMVWRDRRDKYPELYEILRESFELNGRDIFDNNLVAFMDAIRRHKLTRGNISDEQVLEHFDEIMGIIDFKEQQNGNTNKYVKYREAIEKFLEATVDIDCDFIKNNYMQKLKEDPENVELANKIVKYSFASKCTDEDFFIEAAKVVTKMQPDYGLLKYLATKYKDREQFDKAEATFNKANEFAEDNIKKGEVFMELADIANKKGNKALARSYLYKAIESDPTNRETAYKQIGYLYYSSYEECKGGKSVVDDRAVFIAAYEMYAKAGDQKMMENCKAQFPSVEEIFTYGKKKGGSITVNCWINETVTIKTRD